MDQDERIERLKQDGSEVGQRIEELQNKINKINNKREEAIIKSEYDKFMKLTKEYKTKEILELVESMDNKSPEELFEIIDKIIEIYKPVRQRIENELR